MAIVMHASATSTDAVRAVDCKRYMLQFCLDSDRLHRQKEGDGAAGRGGGEGGVKGACRYVIVLTLQGGECTAF